MSIQPLRSKLQELDVLIEQYQTTEQVADLFKNIAILLNQPGEHSYETLFRLKNAAQKLQTYMDIEKMHFTPLYARCIAVSLKCQCCLGVKSFTLEDLKLINENFDQKVHYHSYSKRKYLWKLINELESREDAKETVATIKTKIQAIEKQLTQNDFKNLLISLNHNTVHNHSFNNLLHWNGFSPDITNIDFTRHGVIRAYWGVASGTELLQRLNFDGIRFTRCQFPWVNMSASHFRNCYFKDCDFTHALFGQGSHLVDCSFKNCKIHRATINHAKLDKVSFSQCTITHTDFSYTILRDVNLQTCNLKGSSFLFTTIETTCHADEATTGASECFWNTEGPHFGLEIKATAESPQVFLGMWWGSQSPCGSGLQLESALVEAEGLPLRMEYNPTHISAASVREETKILIKRQRTCGFQQSILKQLITDLREAPDTEFPNLNRLMNYVKSYIDHINCLVLPGGSDIEAEFYLTTTPYKHHADYRRTLVESFSLYFAQNRGIPTIAVCRGCQLTGIYQGAKLDQHVSGHSGTIQLYSHHTPGQRHGKGLIRQIAGSWTIGHSLHHQAIARASLPKDTLEIVTEYKGVIKALESTRGAPLLLYQWHPEVGTEPPNWLEWFVDKLLVTSDNKQLWKELVKMGKTYKQRHAVIDTIRLTHLV